jgi:hypothetical protein
MIRAADCGRERCRVNDAINAVVRFAHEMFTAMGVGAFAARAERELRATRERVRNWTVETRDDLTAREAQIARFASEGLSNPEIGTRLFISPRTVQYHLHRSSPSWASVHVSSSTAHYRTTRISECPSRLRSEVTGRRLLALGA